MAKIHKKYTGYESSGLCSCCGVLRRKCRNKKSFIGDSQTKTNRTIIVPVPGEGSDNVVYGRYVDGSTFVDVDGGLVSLNVNAIYVDIDTLREYIYLPDSNQITPTRHEIEDIDGLEEALSEITNGIPFWEQPTPGNGYNIDDKVLYEVGGTTYVFVSNVDDNEVEPTVPENPEWLLVGVEDSNIVRYSRRIDTDSTLTGGGDLSQDRTLGIASGIVPYTSTTLSNNTDLNSVTEVGFYHNSSLEIPGGLNYPIDGAKGSLQVLRWGVSQRKAQIFITRSNSVMRYFFRTTSDTGAWSSVWIELARDHTVVHRAGNLAETITGLKTFSNRVQLSTGTTTEPPLKIPTGTLTTVPQAGAVEVFDDEIRFTNEMLERSVIETKRLPKSSSATSYTLLKSDRNKRLKLTNSSAITATIPAGVFKAGDSIVIVQGGVGQVEFIAGAGMTIEKAVSDSLFTAEQGAIVEVYFESNSLCHVYGRLELL